MLERNYTSSIFKAFEVTTIWNGCVAAYPEYVLRENERVVIIQVDDNLEALKELSSLQTSINLKNMSQSIYFTGSSNIKTDGKQTYYFVLPLNEYKNNREEYEKRGIKLKPLSAEQCTFYFNELQSYTEQTNNKFSLYNLLIHYAKNIKQNYQNIASLLRSGQGVVLQPVQKPTQVPRFQYHIEPQITQGATSVSSMNSGQTSFSSPTTNPLNSNYNITNSVEAFDVTDLWNEINKDFPDNIITPGYEVVLVSDKWIQDNINGLYNVAKSLHPLYSYFLFKTCSNKGNYCILPLAAFNAVKSTMSAYNRINIKPINGNRNELIAILTKNMSNYLIHFSKNSKKIPKAKLGKPANKNKIYDITKFSNNSEPLCLIIGKKNISQLLASIKQHFLLKRYNINYEGSLILEFIDSISMLHEVGDKTYFIIPKIILNEYFVEMEKIIKAKASNELRGQELTINSLYQSYVSDWIIPIDFVPSIRDEIENNNELYDAIKYLIKNVNGSILAINNVANRNLDSTFIAIESENEFWTIFPENMNSNNAAKFDHFTKMTTPINLTMNQPTFYPSVQIGEIYPNADFIGTNVGENSFNFSDSLSQIIQSQNQTITMLLMQQTKTLHEIQTALTGLSQNQAFQIPYHDGNLPQNPEISLGLINVQNQLSRHNAQKNINGNQKPISVYDITNLLNEVMKDTNLRLNQDERFILIEQRWDILENFINLFYAEIKKIANANFKPLVHIERNNEEIIKKFFFIIPESFYKKHSAKLLNKFKVINPENINNPIISKLSQEKYEELKQILLKSKLHNTQHGIFLQIFNVLQLSKENEELKKLMFKYYVYDITEFCKNKNIANIGENESVILIEGSSVDIRLLATAITGGAFIRDICPVNFKPGEIIKTNINSTSLGGSYLIMPRWIYEKYYAYLMVNVKNVPRIYTYDYSRNLTAIKNINDFPEKLAELEEVYDARCVLLSNRTRLFSSILDSVVKGNRELKEITQHNQFKNEVTTNPKNNMEKSNNSPIVKPMLWLPINAATGSHNLQPRLFAQQPHFLGHSIQPKKISTQTQSMDHESDPFGLYQSQGYENVALERNKSKKISNITAIIISDDEDDKLEKTSKKNEEMVYSQTEKNTLIFSYDKKLNVSATENTPSRINADVETNLEANVKSKNKIQVSKIVTEYNSIANPVDQARLMDAMEIENPAKPLTQNTNANSESIKPSKKRKAKSVENKGQKVARKEDKNKLVVSEDERVDAKLDEFVAEYIEEYMNSSVGLTYSIAENIDPKADEINKEADKNAHEKHLDPNYYKNFIFGAAKLPEFMNPIDIQKTKLDNGDELLHVPTENNINSNMDINKAYFSFQLSLLKSHAKSGIFSKSFFPIVLSLISIKDLSDKHLNCINQIINEETNKFHRGEHSDVVLKTDFPEINAILKMNMNPTGLLCDLFIKTDISEKEKLYSILKNLVAMSGENNTLITLVNLYFQFKNNGKAQSKIILNFIIDEIENSMEMNGNYFMSDFELFTAHLDFELKKVPKKPKLPVKPKAPADLDPKQLLSKNNVSKYEQSKKKYANEMIDYEKSMLQYKDEICIREAFLIKSKMIREFFYAKSAYPGEYNKWKEKMNKPARSDKTLANHTFFKSLQNSTTPILPKNPKALIHAIVQRILFEVDNVNSDEILQQWVKLHDDTLESFEEEQRVKNRERNCLG